MNAIIQKLELGQGCLQVLIKDTIDIQGSRTQAGSQALADGPKAPQHSQVVSQILKHNCKIIGKTNLHELAFGITGINYFTGTPINPNYPDLICGGSSSGSAAAVAGHLCDFSIGTDTGGSIRLPATCCGIYGLKPTFGRISRNGVLPAQSTLDCVGPMANDPDMLIKAMQIIDPTFDLQPLSSLHLKHLKFAYLDVPAHPVVWSTIQDFFKSLNFCEVKKLTPQYMQHAFKAGLQIINNETYLAFSHLLDSGKLGQDIQLRLKEAGMTTLADIKWAEKVRQQFTQEINLLLENLDLLILPTLPQIPPKLSDVQMHCSQFNLTSLIRPFNLSGHPALSIPLQTTDNLPVGLQLIAKHGQDEKLCLISRLLMEKFNSLRD